MLMPHEIIDRPVVSEKSVAIQQAHNQVTFRCHPDANKIQIRDAIQALFKVKVTRVNTITMRGVARRMRGRPGVTAAWKKAIVTLADGQKIEGV
jgi:large subunit ribosomal protein L23